MSIRIIGTKDDVLGYRISVYLGKDQNGKLIYKTKTIYGTEKQAKEMERQMLVVKTQASMCQTERDIYERVKTIKSLTKKILLKNAFELAMEKPQNQGISSEKRMAKLSYWRDFIDWSSEKYPLIRYMNDVSVKHAEDYIAFVRHYGTFERYKRKNGLVNKLSSYTLNSIQNTLKMVFDVLKNDSGVFDNPFESIKLLKLKTQEREAYNEQQLRIIFEKADEYIYPMFFIGLFTGLSEGDICTLRKEDVNFAHHHIYRKRNKTKNSSGKISAIPMMPILENYIANLMANDNDSEYILPKHAADYEYSRPDVSRTIKEFLEVQCGFDTQVVMKHHAKAFSVLDFHSLRHTFCSIAGAVGIPITIVQSIVGHMTPKMTEYYSRHTEDADRLRWIGLFGERVKSLPSLTYNDKAISEDEKIRAELISEIKLLPLDDVKTLLEMVGTLKDNY